jgi:hypothetical protein
VKSHPGHGSEDNGFRAAQGSERETHPWSGSRGLSSGCNVLRHCQVSGIWDHARADLLGDERQLARQVIPLLLDSRQLVLAALQLLPGILQYMHNP